MIGWFFLGTRFNTTNDEAMMTIPARDNGSGCSPGSRTQLSMAPKRGIRNFQKFRSETLFSGLFSNMVHKDMATADSTLSQVSER